MYWNLFFHRSTSDLSIRRTWVCWDFYGNDMGWQAPWGMQVLSQPPFSSSLSGFSNSFPLSFHLIFENPVMPCLILHCTGPHTLWQPRGALETASGFWKKFRTSDEASDSSPGCWEELCGKQWSCPFPCRPSLPDLPCRCQWIEESL